MNKLLVVLCSSCIFFSACLVGPRYERPSEVNAPTTFKAGLEGMDTSNASIRWDILFNDPTLKALVDSVIANNPDVRIAAARIQEAEAQYKVNRANILPELYYSAGAARVDRNDVSIKTNPANEYNLSLGLNWEIDFWGKYRHASRSARYQMLATKQGYQAVRNSLGALTLTLYFQLRDLDNRLLIAESTFSSRLEYFNIVKARFEGGDVSELDKLQSEQQLAIAEASVPNFKRQINQVENALSVLLGKSPGDILRGRLNAEQPEPAILPAGLPSSILEQRPDVKSAEYRYMSEVEKVGIFQAQRFPSVSLTGMFGLVSPELNKILTDDAFSNSLSGSLLGPVFAFGKYKRRMEAQKKVAEQSMQQYRQTYLNALADVADAIVAVNTSKLEHAARKRQAAAAKKALDLSKARYDNGYTTYLEVLDAQRSMFDAELQESITLQQQLNATVELYRSLGGSF